MGLSDRDYAREPSSGFQLRAPETAVGLLIAVNVGLYLLDMLLSQRVPGGDVTHVVSNSLKLRSDLLEHPWNCWQLITYGFVHDPNNIWHILGNMFALWFFGGDIERMYGRAEFLRIYFAGLLAGSLFWLVSQNTLMPHAAPAMLGASGAVTCIWVLYALHFPTRMILLGGFLPMPMWLFGIITLVPDFFGFVAALQNRPTSNVAFEAHLGGAALALAYQRFGWNFGRWLPRSVTMSAPRLRPSLRPKLKLHQPPAEQPDLDTEVDRILAKITAAGTDSLTPEEKRLLERASARARSQQRRT